MINESKRQDIIHQCMVYTDDLTDRIEHWDQLVNFVDCQLQNTLGYAPELVPIIDILQEANSVVNLLFKELYGKFKKVSENSDSNT